MADETRDITAADPVYVTKWALTEGVMKFVTGKVVVYEDNPNLAYFSVRWGVCNGIFVGPKDWTHDIQVAKERYHDLIVRKMATLDRQKAKMEKKLNELMVVKEVA